MEENNAVAEASKKTYIHKKIRDTFSSCDILRPLKVFCFAKNPRLRLGGRRP